MAWLVMNIGCIECGVSSKIVGVFTEKVTAENVASKLDESHSWREGGQNSFEVFELPAFNVVDPEYSPNPSSSPQDKA
jgi:hypothetical protein